MKSLGTPSSIPQTPRTGSAANMRGGDGAPSDQQLERLDYWAALQALRDEYEKLQESE